MQMTQKKHGNRHFHACNSHYMKKIGDKNVKKISILTSNISFNYTASSCKEKKKNMPLILNKKTKAKLAFFAVFASVP